MFEVGKTPRCFALPLGVDFSVAFLTGLRARLNGLPPETMARVEIFVNTRRTERRLHDLLLEGPPSLLPRIRVITGLANDPTITTDIPPAISPIRRRLELARTIAAMLDKDPDLAPRAAMFDLADSLAGLMDEMQGEGISADALSKLDIADVHAVHWQRSLTFLKILAPYFDDKTEPDTEARQRMVIEHLAQKWAAEPPTHPVLVVGSTGSRGATAVFMRAVARLPQGAVVLPGFDFDLPDRVWEALEDQKTSADHPQSGLLKFVRSLELSPGAVEKWSDETCAHPARNRLISLAMRPAPVTDQWLNEGPKLGDLATATQNMSLLQAASPRQEAMAIALCLRSAAQNGRKATLITPDRQLTRQVTAALQRWKILPDDSAGRPLALTPPGIFLRLVSEMMGQRPTSEGLLILLKHPLTNSAEKEDESGRNQHLLNSRNLELDVLRGGAPFPDFTAIDAWGKIKLTDAKSNDWLTWLMQSFKSEPTPSNQSLSDHLKHHRKLAEAISAGPNPQDTTGELWSKETGEEAAKVFEELEKNADAGGDISATEYTALFRSVINKAEVRNTFTPHPNITIWGTLEARVQGADLVILGGLNDGIWPKLPEPDPWLNRPMRAEAGLLLPERRIGLSAHDFQQAIAAPEVLLTRSIRDADAPTVASRWLIRLTNLLSGLGEQGNAALVDMKAQGQYWADLAQALEKPQIALPAENRPSPRPPVKARPDGLSVTQIRTLIRDPYAIYARNVLGLRKLEPIRHEPDALVRGQALHNVLQVFIEETLENLPEDGVHQFLTLAERIFETDVPWPATRRLWLARLGRVAQWFIAGEQNRRARGNPASLECWGSIKIDEPAFTLFGQADRIDRAVDGGLIIYDYKTGALPTKGQIEYFDKQLPLEGAMAQRGAFDDLEPGSITGLEYIGLGSNKRVYAVEIDDDQINAAWEGLRSLIRAYQKPTTGYTARSRMEKRTDKSDYDHLSRLGEWQDSDAPVGEDMS